MFKRVIATVTLVSAALLWMLLVMTSPSSSGPLGILILFVLMYMTALGALTFLFYEGSSLQAKVATIVRGKASVEKLSFQKAYYYASVGALAPVMILAMQSVRQVGPYQLLLVIFFIVIAWIYIAKRAA